MPILLSWNWSLFNSLINKSRRYANESSSDKLNLYYSGRVYCVKPVCIRSFSRPYFPSFGLNIQSKRGKILTRKTSNTDTFYAVYTLYRYLLGIHSLSANPTKWSNTLKQFFGNIRGIVWLYLTILWGWHLKG